MPGKTRGYLTLPDGTRVPILDFHLVTVPAHPRRVFEIRPLREDDADDLIRLDRISFGPDERWGRTGFHRYLGGLQVAVVDGALAGFAAWRRAGGCLWLKRIAISPDYRRAQVATTLVWDKLHCLRDWGRERLIRCEVPADNLPMHLFLNSCGWIAAETVTMDDGQWTEFLMREAWFKAQND